MSGEADVVHSRVADLRFRHQVLSEHRPHPRQQVSLCTVHLVNELREVQLLSRIQRQEVVGAGPFIETQVAITALRVTSTGPDTGVDYYVTDLSLTGR